MDIIGWYFIFMDMYEFIHKYIIYRSAIVYGKKKNEEIKSNGIKVQWV